MRSAICLLSAVALFGGGNVDAIAAPTLAKSYTEEFRRIHGGSHHDSVGAVTSDSEGNVYIAGTTYSTNLPGVTGALAGPGGRGDAFLMKLDSDGHILFSRVVGGSSSDEPSAVAVDSAGSIYVAGNTWSTNFPAVLGLQTTNAGTSDGFVFKLAPDGGLLYSTYFGGAAYDSIRDVVVPSNGEPLLFGETADFSFATNAVSQNGDFNAFVARVNASGSALVYVRLIGGAGFEHAGRMAVDGAGNVYVCGATDSMDFFTTPDAFQRWLSWLDSGDYQNSDVYVVKLNASGDIVYSTLWSAEGSEVVNDIAVDSEGRIYLAGYTGFYWTGVSTPRSPGFPAGLPPLDEKGASGFIVRLEASGNEVGFVWRPESSRTDTISLVRIDASGSVHLAGFSGAVPYLGQLDSSGSGLVRVQQFDDCRTADVGGLEFVEGNLFAVGTTASPGQSGYDPNSYDIFAARLSREEPAPAILPSVVGLTLPQDNSTYSSVEIVPVLADFLPVASNTQMRLYAGNTLLAHLDAPPFGVYWTNPPVGVHQVFAVTVNAGVFSTSCVRTVRVILPPTNDQFGRSTRVTGQSFTIQGTTAGATSEPGEPEDVFPSGSHSVWWCWTAPTNAVYTVQVSGESYTKVDVFSGTDFSNLARVGSRIGYSVEAVSFKAAQGTTYHFKVDSHSIGEFTLSLAQTVAPPNDDYENRIPLAGSHVTATGSNVSATLEPALARDATGAASVWWTWAAPEAGSYMITTSSESGDAVVSVFRANTNIAYIPGTSGGPQRPVRASFAGEVFDIRVASQFGTPGQFTLSVLPLPRPGNDDFEEASAISEFPTTATGTTFGATSQESEPWHYYDIFPPQNSVWYSWTAPSNEVVILQLTMSPYSYSVLAVYTGPTLTNLTQLHVADGADPLLLFDVAAGTEYRIAVDTYQSAPFEFELTIRPPQRDRAPNDDFANRIYLAGSPAVIVGRITEATLEPDEPLPPLGSPLGSIWYSWIAPSNGTYTARAVLDSQNTAPVWIYAGNALTNLTAVTTNAGGEFIAVGGAEYHIAVLGYSFHNLVRLSIRPTVRPPNDDFANRQVLFGESVAVSASNVDASLEPMEPALPEPEARSSVWWTWTAPSSGIFRVSIRATRFQPLLRLYSGTNLAGLSLLTNRPPYFNNVVIPAVSGQEVQIAVYSWGIRQGSLTLEVERVQPPPNDNFADALTLSGATVAASVNTSGATGEPGEPTHDLFQEAQASAWWNWTAPASGIGTIMFSGNPLVGVYTGETLASLVRVTNSTWSAGSPLRFNVTAGITYRIAVDDSSLQPVSLIIVGPSAPFAGELRGFQSTNRSFAISFEAGLGRSAVIEASLNLVSWQAIATNVIDCSPFVFIDHEATNYTGRFYRVRTH